MKIENMRKIRKKNKLKNEKICWKYRRKESGTVKKR
jgi:hypothetical protein